MVATRASSQWSSEVVIKRYLMYKLNMLGIGVVCAYIYAQLKTGWLKLEKNLLLYSNNIPWKIKNEKLN